MKKKEYHFICDYNVIEVPINVKADGLREAYLLLLREVDMAIADNTLNAIILLSIRR